MLPTFSRRKIVTALLLFVWIICTAIGICLLHPGAQLASAAETEENYVASVGDVKYTTLQTAIESAQSGETVTLLKDIKIDSAGKVVSPEGTSLAAYINGKSLTLDGGEHTISSDILQIMHVIGGTKESLVTVTIKNLTIKSIGESACPLMTRGGNLTLILDNVTLDAFESEYDKNAQVLTIARNNNRPVPADERPVVIIQNGSELKANRIGYALELMTAANVTVTKSTLSGWSVIYFKGGTRDSTGSEVTVENSVLTSSLENVNNSFGMITFEDGGIELSISNSTINLSADNTSLALVYYSGQGSTPTDNTVVLTNNDVKINGGPSDAMLVGISPSLAEEVKSDLTISGGTINVRVPAEYLAEGMLLFPNADGTYSVGDETAVTEAGMTAVIGNVAYKTLAEAVAAVPADGVQVTITLIGGENNVITGNGVKFNDGQNIEIDFNGKTYNVDKTVGSAGTETNGFQLLKGSVVTLKNGAMTSDTAKILLQNYCNLTLDDMKLDLSDKEQINYVISNNCGETVITGDTQIIAPKGGVAFDVYYGLGPNYYDGVSVTFGEDFTGMVKGTVEYGAQVVTENWQDKSKLTIENGNFDITFKVNTGDATEANITANGGNFGIVLPEEYLGAGNSLYTDGNGGYAVAPANTAPENMEKVAVLMDGEGYATIAEAIEAARGGDDISLTLYDDLVENVVIPAGKTVVLNLNGKTITAEKDNTIENIGNLTINGEGSIVADAMRTALRNRSGATLTVNGGTIFSVSGTALNSAGTLIVNGGTFTTDGGGQAATLTGNSTITGGKFITNTSATSTASNAITAMVGELTIKGGTFEAGKQAIAASAGATVIIEGGDFSVRSYAGGNILYGDQAKIIVSGGTFKAPNSDTVEAVNVTASGSAEISGGEFSVPVSEELLKDGFALSYDSQNNTFAPEEGTVFAHVDRDGKTYAFTQPAYAISFAEEGETVVIDVSFKINGSIVINKGINLDLNGHTITGTSENYATVQVNGLVKGQGFAVEIFSSVEGGKIVSENCIAVWALRDANVTLSDIELKGANGADVGYNGEAYDASLTLNNVAVTATAEEGYGIGVWGNNNDTLSPVTLIANNSTITAPVYAISGNGLYHNTYIELNNCNITATLGDPETPDFDNLSTGIFHPQEGELFINGGFVTGVGAAVEIRSGSLTVTGNAVLTAKCMQFDIRANGNGTTTSGAALAISQHTTNKDIKVTIDSGTFNGVKAVYEQDIQDDNSSNISMSISGGEFNGAVESENVKTFISGGIYSVLPDENAFAEGLTSKLYNGYYMVVNTEDVNATASIADRLSAQSGLRDYLAAFGLTVADMQAIAENDEFAADIVAAYENILSASTKDDVADALIAAMDAVDAYNNAVKEAFEEYKAEKIAELENKLADDEDTADVNESVVLPTATWFALNNAGTKAEFDEYFDNALDEAEAIRTYRADITAQTNQLTGLAETLASFEGNMGGEFDKLLTDVQDAIGKAQKAIVGNDGSDSLASIQEYLEGTIKITLDSISAALMNMSGNVASILSAINELDISEELKDEFSTVATAISDAQKNINDNTDSQIGSTIEKINRATEAAVTNLRNELVGENGTSGVLGNLSNAVTRLEAMLGGEDGLAAIKGELDDVIAALGTATDSDTLFGLLEAIESGNAAIQSVVTEMQTSLTGTLKDMQKELTASAEALDTITGTLAEETGWVSEDIAAAKAEIDKIVAALGSLGAGEGSDLATQIGNITASLEDVQGTVGNIAESVDASTAVEVEKDAALSDIETWLNDYLDNILGTIEEANGDVAITAFAFTAETTDGDIYAKLAQAFSEDNAKLVLKYYNDALAAIDSATTVSEVTTAVSTFKAQVASVEAAAGNTPSLTAVYILLAVVLVVAIAVFAAVLLRRAPAPQPAAPAEGTPAAPAQETAVTEAAPEGEVSVSEGTPEDEASEEAPAEESAAEERAVNTIVLPELDGDREHIVIAANVRSFDEAYEALGDEARSLFNKVKAYALSKPDTEEIPLSSGVCIKRGSKKVVKLAVRRGNPVALFLLESDGLKDLRRSASASVRLKVRETELVLREESDLEAAYTMVDLSIGQIERDIEEAKERRREVRRLRRRQLRETAASEAAVSEETEDVPEEGAADETPADESDE